MLDPVVQMVTVRWLVGVAIVFGILVALEMKRDWLASQDSYLP